MIITEKKQQIARHKDGTFDMESDIKYFVCLASRHYDIEVTKGAYESVEVKQDVDIFFLKKSL